ncbi:MAG TPA: ferritin family protein [Phycisphaerae bacterium]|nr:ferritin family protein [Phycisphaerae bacterium]
MSQMFFNEIEGAKIAQNMEKNGVVFYQKAAAKAESAAVRDTFLQFAEDEKTHLARFEELEETLQRERRNGAGYADDAEIASYIDGLLKTQVFGDEGDVARLADQAEDDLAALAVAMRAERDSILFYQEMMGLVDSKDAQAAFSTILDEERDHLRILGERSEHCENCQG